MKDRDHSSPGLSGVAALVLGAGFGTRLRPLTEHIPKPVIPLLGRPLLGHPLIHLYAAGCHEVWVNAHHRPEQLAARLDPWVQRRLQRMRVRYSIEQPSILGTAGAVRLLEDELAGSGRPFLLLNGDAVLAMDLPALFAAHARNREEGALATLLCIPHAEAARYGAVRVDPDGRILDLAGLGRRAGAREADVAAATPTVFCGVHVIEPALLAHLPPRGQEACIVRQGYAPLLAAGHDVRAVLLPENAVFHDVGTASRYLDAQRDLLGAPPLLPVAGGGDAKEALFQEAVYAVDAQGREYGSPDAVAGLAGAVLHPPFFFGPRNELGAGAIIGPNTSLGALNVVGAGAMVADAALWSQVEVGAGERLAGVLATRVEGRRCVVEGRAG